MIHHVSSSFFNDLIKIAILPTCMVMMKSSGSIMELAQSTQARLEYHFYLVERRRRDGRHTTKRFSQPTFGEGVTIHYTVITVRRVPSEHTFLMLQTPSFC